MKRKRPNLLANRTVTVSYARNGLTLEVSPVPATDGMLVAKALLDGVRGLIAAGYDELVADGAAFHAAAVDQPEELDDPDFAMPPLAGPPRRSPIGFS